MPKKTHIFQYLSSNGDGTGTTNLNGDYSSAASEFNITPAAGEVYELHRMIVTIADTGVMDAGNYGVNVTLTNGILVRYRDSGGTVTDMTGGVAIKTNAEWGRVCYDVQEVAFGGGDNYVSIRWTFSKAGAPLVLKGDEGDYFGLLLNDDFTGLNGHYFMVQGLKGAAGYQHEFYE